MRSLWILILLPNLVFCQAKLAFLERNKLSNSASLHRMFAKLQRIKNGSNEVLIILHLGDSHLQAGILTEITRNELQKMFGNAGRGLLVPFRVGKSNEPSDYRSEATGNWTSQSAIKFPTETGIGAFSVSTKDSTANLRFFLKETYTVARLFYEDNENSFQLQITPKNAKGKITADSNSEAVIQLDNPSNALKISTSKTISNQTVCKIHGVSFETNQPGVLYHTVGVNGLQMSQINNSSKFFKQGRSLNPDLIIVSLGTNEAFNAIPQITVNQHIKKFIERTKLALPNTSILFSTPLAGFKKGRENHQISEVSENIIDLCKTMNFAYWDSHSIGGSAFYLRKNRLIQPDGVHYTTACYRLQGEALFDALIGAYRDYAQTPNR